MGNVFKHAGIVESVMGDKVKVRISQSSACVSCEVSGNCQISKSRERLIDVVSKGSKYQEGDAVMVVITRRTGMKSVALAFGIPFLLLILTIFGVWTITKNEGISALASLVALGGYYCVLYLCRQRIADKISINLE